MFLKTSITFVLSAAMSLVAFAGTVDIDKEIKKISEMVDVGTNGGAADVLKYDKNHFSYKKEISDILNSIRGSECKYETIIGRNQLMSSISDMAIFSDAPVAITKLTRLHKSNQIEAVVGYYWTGESGDSEYCSTEEIRIYFKNGKVLVINFDSTT